MTGVFPPPSPPVSEATDPALLDNSLQRKLRANREVALSRLEEVISKYAVKQEDMEEQDRSRRQEKEVRVWSSCRHFLFDTRCRLNFKDSFFFFQDNKPEEGEEKKAVNGVTEEEERPEEEEDDEDDDSSDPDIEEEIRASTQQDGAGQNTDLFLFVTAPPPPPPPSPSD